MEDIKYTGGLDIESAPEHEYMLSGALLSALGTKEFYAQYAKESENHFLYNQNEFAAELGYNLCTVYSAMTALSAVLGKEISKEDRYEMAKLRYNQPDFDRNRGGKVAAWVDVVRNYWNKKYPNEAVVTFYLRNDSSLRVDTLYAKWIPLISGYYGNAKYNDDVSDGVLDWSGYTPFTYAHSIAYMKDKALDNYNNSYTIPLKIFIANSKAGVNHIGAYLISRSNLFNGNGALLIRALQSKVWNGDRINEMITRREAAIILSIVSGVEESKIWWGSEPNRRMTEEECTIMTTRAFGKGKSFTRKSGLITRWQFVLEAMSRKN